MPNTYRQTQRDRQNEEVEEYAPNQRTSKPLEKDFNGDKQPTWVQSNSNKDAYQFQEKNEKTQQEHQQRENSKRYQMKVITEVKKNTLEGLKSRMAKIEAQISKMGDKALEKQDRAAKWKKI